MCDDSVRVILQLNLITTAVCIQVNSNRLGDNSITTIKVSGYAIYKVSGCAIICMYRYVAVAKIERFIYLIKNRIL